jgi:hypothetical protein
MCDRRKLEDSDKIVDIIRMSRPEHITESVMRMHPKDQIAFFRIVSDAIRLYADNVHLDARNAPAVQWAFDVSKTRPL